MRLAHTLSRVLLALALCLPLRAQVVEETGSLLEFLGGSEPGCAYDNFFSHIVEGIASPGYNYYGPEGLDPQTNGFGDYERLYSNTYGNGVMALFEEITEYLLEDNPTAAAQALAEEEDLHYEIVHLTEAGGREFYLIREELDNQYFDEGFSALPGDDVVGSFNHGWGLTVVAVNPGRPGFILQSPHPNDDYPANFITAQLFYDGGGHLMQINGAGREVDWNDDNNNGAYANGESRSDPTRYCQHPFVAVHEAAVDWMREQEIVDLTVQLHTYDDYSGGHRRTLKSAVFSSGRSHRVGLPPYFDPGYNDLGCLNLLTSPVIGSNSMGWVHEPVDIEDYIAINTWNEVPVDGGNIGQEHWISISPDLWGYPENCLMANSHADFEDCDDYERWLHIEFDELPQIAHDLGDEAFYHADASAVADWSNYDLFMDYYNAWKVALIQAISNTDDWDPESAPAPTAITNLSVSSVDTNTVTLTWDPTHSSNFETYEVWLDTLDHIGINSWMEDSGDYSRLCWAGDRYVTVGPLPYRQQYTFALRGRDSQDRLTDLSNEVSGYADDLRAPLIYILVPNSSGTHYSNGVNDSIRVRLRDVNHHVDLSSLDYRVDANGDGTYGGTGEEWTSFGLTGSFHNEALYIPFSPQLQNCGHFELRCYDDQNPVYGYSGSDREEGIGDDQHTVCWDDTPPPAINGFEFTGFDGASFLLAWEQIEEDETFRTFRLLLSNLPFEEASEALYIIDRSDDGDLDEEDLTAFAWNSPELLGETVYAKLQTEDYAGNYGEMASTSFLYMDPAWCGVEDLRISIQAPDLELHWSSHVIEGFEILGYSIYRLPTPWAAREEWVRVGMTQSEDRQLILSWQEESQHSLCSYVVIAHCTANPL